MRATLIVTLISLVLSLAAGEAYLRFAGFAPKPFWVNANFDGSNWGMEDPEFGWVNRPGSFRSLEKGGADMSFQPDHTRTSRPATDRKAAAGGAPAGVLLVGCSFTQGYSVADAETYAWRLNERFPGIVVDNFGTGGYSTYQAYLRVKHELERRKDDPPKLVVLGFIAHQMVRTVAAADWVKYLTDSRGNMLVPPHATVDAEGRMVGHPLETIAPWPLEDRSALVAEVHRAVLRGRFGDRAAQQVPATAAVIRAMRDLAEARGARFAVALLDDLSLPDGKPAYDALVAALGQAKVERLDCVDPDYDRNPGAHQVGGAGHPDAGIHAGWAGCVGNWIARTLPSAPRAGGL